MYEYLAEEAWSGHEVDGEPVGGLHQVVPCLNVGNVVCITDTLHLHTHFNLNPNLHLHLNLDLHLHLNLDLNLHPHLHLHPPALSAECYLTAGTARLWAEHGRNPGLQEMANCTKNISSCEF